MINFNFLGMGSFSGVQQKGKVNGANSVECEIDGEGQGAEAAFPNILMQLLLGQQLPVTIPVVTAQQLVSPDSGEAVEVPASEKQLMTSVTSLPLQNQLLAGEMKKNSAIKKGSSQKTTSEEPKVALVQTENVELSELPLEIVKVSSEKTEGESENKNPESAQIISDAKIVLEGTNILSQMAASDSTQQTVSGQQKENNASSETTQKVTNSPKPVISTPSLKTSIFHKSTDNKPVIDDSQSIITPKTKPTVENNNLFMQEIAKPTLKVKTGISTADPEQPIVLMPKKENANLLSKEYQKVESSKIGSEVIAPNKTSIENNNLFLKEIIKAESGLKTGLLVSDQDDQIPLEIKNQIANPPAKEIQKDESVNIGAHKINSNSIGQENEVELKPRSIQNPFVKNETVTQNGSSSINQSMKKKTSNDSELVTKSTNDVQQLGILSDVTVHNIKTSKSNNEQSPLTFKSDATEKQSLTKPIEATNSEAFDKNEQQNKGNTSFAPKETIEHQLSSEKSVSPIDERQNQQVFTGILEEKNNSAVSKTHQVNVTTLLRQQDTVNNIVEQLAKNVTLSLNENNSEIKISLKPEALGDVMLKVTMEHGKVSTQMEVQQPQVKAVIEANIQILRDSLSSKGLVLDKIDISTSQFLPNEKSSHQGQHHSGLKNYFGKEIDEDITEQTKLFGYNTVDYVA